MEKLKRVLFFGISICIFFVGSACGGSLESKLVGRWRLPEEETAYFRSLEFFSNGTYTSSRENYEGNYSVDGDRIKLQGFLVESKTYTFKVNNSELTLINSKGEEICVYEKVSE